ncbi:MAG: exported protein of unknown function [Candidatus Saccharibacteria bacterium]|nr:exported protein of unknown function [Candidatus Saccharibacteria bacterium]
MKSVCYSLIALMLITAVIGSAPVFAQDASTSTPMTDEHVALIRSSCQSALATLGQIHANDAPTYINRNQTYFSISDKLMARLNSRLTLNRYDATQLVKTASDYNTALLRFRTVYKQYDDTMANLIRTDCKKQPVGFYDSVAVARDQRQKVHEVVLRLQTLIDQYRKDIQDFQVKHVSQLTGGSND